jgi:hydrogenase maturation protease
MVSMKLLVLGLGNELFGDDALGIMAARILRDRLVGCAEVIESAESGLGLLDLMVGYDHAVIVDAVCTGRHPVGEVLQWRMEDLGPVAAPTPHYAGLPELTAIANGLKVDFPQDIVIYAMEIADAYTIREGLTHGILHQLPYLIERVEAQIIKWLEGNFEAAEKFA